MTEDDMCLMSKAFKNKDVGSLGNFIPAETEIPKKDPNFYHI